MRRIAAAIVLAALSIAGPARATEPFVHVGRIYSTSPLEAPRSARNQAMGGAGVADPYDPATTLYNPANLAAVEGYATFYNRHDLDRIVDIKVHDAGFVVAKAWGNGMRSAVGVRHVDQSFEMPVYRTVFLPEGTAYNANDRAIAVTVAGSTPFFGANLALGMTVERALVDVQHDDVESWAFDVGLRVDLPGVENARGDRFDPRVGVSVLNAGDGFDVGTLHQDSPRQVRVGVGATYSSGMIVTTPLSRRGLRMVTVTVDLDAIPEDASNDAFTAAAGAELGLAQTLFLRIGNAGQIAEQGAGTTYGAGIAITLATLVAHADVAVCPTRTPISESETVWGLSLVYCP